jgi:1-aminocyclopropane-1-carboxylate deaminase
MISYTETPVQEIHDPLLEQKGIRLLVKREDLNHPEVSGNKWWKLKYNLEEARKLKRTTLLSFGGAFSNHIYALAAAAKACELKAIGVIRGDENLSLNRMLVFAKGCGMHLEFISREAYRNKTGNEFIENLHRKFGDFFLIPEGGTNELALKGCEEFADRILSQIKFDYLCLSVGTGGTIAGIVNGLRESKKIVVGFSSLKGGAFLKDSIERMARPNQKTQLCAWRLNTDYHFGGYAKRTRELDDFIITQRRLQHLALDPVYTSKTMFGILDLVAKGEFERGSTILFLHTGGLHGDG